MPILFDFYASMEECEKWFLKKQKRPNVGGSFCRIFLWAESTGSLKNYLGKKIFEHKKGQMWAGASAEFFFGRGVGGKNVGRQTMITFSQ